MAKAKYNTEKIKELLENKYINKCSNKSITFTKECKLYSVELLKEGLTTKEIFKKLGFPNYVINSQVPFQCLNRWKKHLIKKGSIESKRGRKNKEVLDFDKMNLKEQNEYLKAKVAYLEEIKKLMGGDYP